MIDKNGEPQVWRTQKGNDKKKQWPKREQEAREETHEKTSHRSTNMTLKVPPILIPNKISTSL
jgi:hypothetical protein